MQRLYPRRHSFVRGLSADTLLPYFANATVPRCDFFSIDGHHDQPVVYNDMLAAQVGSRPGGLVLADDHSATFPVVQAAWARMKAEGRVVEIGCGPRVPVEVHGFQKGWCLGRFSAGPIAPPPEGHGWRLEEAKGPTPTEAPAPAPA